MSWWMGRRIKGTREHERQIWDLLVQMEERRVSLRHSGTVTRIRHHAQG